MRFTEKKKKATRSRKETVLFILPRALKIQLLELELTLKIQYQYTFFIKISICMLYLFMSVFH